ncbi:ABC transporter substrate-binding protein [Paenibacillus cremeus]|uniref:Extracellular solute-binding protein n=1 Tax=Paenibacillus cremeus TaxID=2163881 RepID=A0A559KA13_9BACL|nr:extracellular solute-binding protein [Paenibacillus cremeus]TVY08949.1 extracellular solute-binding protein [Paenibacillus cremeus]
MKGAGAMRILLVSLIGCLVAVLCTGCMSLGGLHGQEVPSEASPVKITIWSQETKDPRQTTLQESIRKFNQSHPQIQIVPYYYETEAYKNKLRVAMVSGNMPDLFYFWTGDNFKRMVQSGVVADLNGLLSQHSDFRQQFSTEVLQSTSYEGHVYGIPYAVRHVVLWYNKKLFQSYGQTPPASWSDLLNLVQVLSAKGITPFAAAGKERWPLLHWFAYLSNRLGGDDPMQRVLQREALTDPSFVEAGLRFHELVKKKAFPRSFLGMDVAEAERMFLSGKAAMYMEGDWAAGKLLGHNDYGTEVGYFQFPIVDGKGDLSQYYGGTSSGWAISAGSSNTPAAFEVLSFLTSAEENKALAEHSGTVSPIQHLEISKSDTAPALYDYIQFIEHDPTGYFGFYDQVLDESRAQQLLDAVVTFAGEEDMSRQDIEAVLSNIR